MYTFSVENKYGESLELTHNDNYVVKSIEGLDPPDNILNLSRIAGDDGSVFNSAYTDNRTITITLAVNEPAEANRIKLYKYFKAKMPLRVFYKNGERDVYIDGYVQSMPISFFAKKQVVQIVIVCPRPFFKGRFENVTDFSTVDALFEFPFSIESPIPFSDMDADDTAVVENDGDVETGALITISTIGAVTNPKIINSQTNEYFQIDDTFASGDVIILNTTKKEKSVVKVSDGVTTSLVGKINYGSTWLQLVPGSNVFYVTASVGAANLVTSFEVVNLFEGV